MITTGVVDIGAWGCVEPVASYLITPLVGGFTDVAAQVTMSRHDGLSVAARAKIAVLMDSYSGIGLKASPANVCQREEQFACLPDGPPCFITETAEVAVSED